MATNEGNGGENGGSRELTRRTTIYFHPDVAKQLRVYAALEDTTMSEAVNEAVKEWLEQRGFKVSDD